MKRINMKLKLFAGLFIASATMALMSCDDNTNEIGSSASALATPSCCNFHTDEC